MQKRDDGSYLFSPTDLVNFLGCSHCTVLDLRSFSDLLERDEVSDSEMLLRRKGEEHEATYLQILKDEGKTVADIPKDIPIADRSRLTREAMRKGAAVVYQAALLGENWGGFADFLIKTDSPSVLGAFSYEAADTKLARHPRVKDLIQLGVYSSLLANRQGAQPAQAQIVLGDRSTASFMVSDCASYVRHAMQRLEDFAASPPSGSYPEPCSHCSTCHWKETCAAQWQNDDHLSLVANIRRTQAAKLERAGVNTVAQLAALSPETRVPDLHPQLLQRLRAQAALQEHKRRTGENKFELIDGEPGRGFSRLPKPDPGDLFFDMEGDPLYPNGLEYLFGICLLNDGKLEFQAFWAHDHKEERATFGKFMDFLFHHLAAHPRAYVYHYNHYETTALKRLACRYAVAEHQLDDLLRRMKFVDLYKVAREAIRVSEPAYSIKNLETFYMGKRDGDVATAADSIVVYNRWRETGGSELLKQIANYNEVDCISTNKLRDWLLTHRPQSVVWFGGPPPPADAQGAADKTAARIQHEERYADFQRRLLNAATDGESDYRRHLADLLDFHAREERPQWWEFFDRQTRFDDELLDDTECIAGLTLACHPETVKKSLLHTFRFPPQESKRKAGDKVVDIATLASAGTIQNIDDVNLVVSIKRATRSGPLPENLNIGPGGPIETNALREAIYRVATDVLTDNESYPAVRDILSKAKPRIRDHLPGQAIAAGDDLLAATTHAVAHLTDSYIFIQGPPGAGKTHASAHVIVELIRQGKKIGVAANSHKVIHNLLDMIEKMADERGISFDGTKKSSADRPESEYHGKFIQSENSSDNIGLNVSLLAGTAWLFAHERFDRHLDYLFIDEAGQVSVANVVAMGTAARNIVLVGDQMQLGQPIQGVHPGEAGMSILDFLLAGQATVALDRGIFLDHTRRLHPSVCQFISEAFYEGRLRPDPENVKRHLIFDSTINGITPDGIHFLPVTHIGCSQKSEEEGRTIKAYFDQLVGQKFVDKDGSVRVMTTDDILVVSPYNVQVNHLRSVLPAGARVGTVDKFQGQEAPVVLVSMATSDAECLPRDIEFLFSANRLNVALSRAQCLAIVAASPRLLETPCRTINQLRLVNKFCQLVEFAAASNRGAVIAST
jgi:uncharacterized protein